MRNKSKRFFSELGIPYAESGIHAPKGAFLFRDLFVRRNQCSKVSNPGEQFFLQDEAAEGGKR
jgi:hypothetical protein